MKVCNKCLFEKFDSEFPKKRKICKLCYSQINKEYYSSNKREINEKRYEREKDLINKLSEEELIEYRISKNDIVKNFRKRNPDSCKLYYESRKDIIKKNVSNYRSNNKDKINSRNRERYNNDHLFKLSQNIRNLIRFYIKRTKFEKKTKTSEILGCSFEEFKLHLESKFESWMNWDNYGLYNGELNYGWDIDHIIPSSLAINEDDLIKLNHYKNLQPLCSKINRDIKRNII